MRISARSISSLVISWALSFKDGLLCSKKALPGSTRLAELPAAVIPQRVQCNLVGISVPT
jgi:hypothetical protein